MLHLDGWATAPLATSKRARVNGCAGRINMTEAAARWVLLRDGAARVLEARPWCMQRARVHAGGRQSWRRRWRRRGAAPAGDMDGRGEVSGALRRRSVGRLPPPVGAEEDGRRLHGWAL